MAVISETKEERVRYGQEDKYLDQFSHFGWRCTSKRILNRFGSPLPLGEKVSEDDLREKCFYQLIFKREVDESIIPQLDALQAKYEENPIIDVSFGKGRIVWSILLTVAFIVLISLIVSIVSKEKRVSGSVGALIALACFAAGGISALISTGIVRTVRLNKRNDQVSIVQDKIVIEARKLLRQQGDK